MAPLESGVGFNLQWGGPQIQPRVCERNLELIWIPGILSTIAPEGVLNHAAKPKTVKLLIGEFSNLEMHGAWKVSSSSIVIVQISGYAMDRIEIE